MFGRPFLRKYRSRISIVSTSYLGFPGCISRIEARGTTGAAPRRPQLRVLQFSTLQIASGAG